MKARSHFIRSSVWTVLSLAFMGMLVLGCIYITLEEQLPDVSTLKTVKLQVPLRVYSRDAKLIAEFGEKRRLPVRFDQIPKSIIHAVLATEDQRFYDHPGVDLLGLSRAAWELIRTGTKKQGGSTITMQVARNFFLTRKKTYGRKLREVLLAIKIDQTFSKDKILELYLNKIFFGHRAYGIAAAAQVYYGKKLNELTLPQAAMLAGLPQAPSRLNPLANPTQARERRQHVLERMMELGYIDQPTYEQANAAPITAAYHHPIIDLSAPYVAEQVRNTLLSWYGEKIYTDGFRVYTTIEGTLQKTANRLMQKHLLNYDHRHGYRGAERWLAPTLDNDPHHWLDGMKSLPKLNSLTLAVVTQVEPEKIQVLRRDGTSLTVPWAGLKWARPARKNGKLGASPKKASDIVRVGDVIRLQQTSDLNWRLSQVPEIEGALLSLRPNDGAILAMVGGFDYIKSHYNRAIQANRQAGSVFKPFVYSAALAKNYTLATLINDAPIVIADDEEDVLWRPQNYSHQFHGLTRLRQGLTKSKNLVSVRLLQEIGVDYGLDYLKNFGFKREELPDGLSLALGSANVSPLAISRGYATFANGGSLVTPYLVNRVVNNQLVAIYQAQPKPICNSMIHGDCAASETSLTDPTEETTLKQPLTAASNDQSGNIPSTLDPTPAISGEVAYLMNSALKGVIQHGTGRRARSLKRHDIAGKTGTTNDQFDAWFAGYTPDVVTTVWMGFDRPHSLKEYAAQIALPLWIDFMRVALKDKPEQPLLQPSNIVSVRIDPETGLLARPDQKHSLFELFRQRLAPTHSAPAPVTSDQEAAGEEEPSNDTSMPLY